MVNTYKLVEKIASSMFKIFAHTFPIACASDEFFYFPQVKLAEPDWNIWDGFSPETIAEFTVKLSSCENELNRLNSDYYNLDIEIDIALLKKLAGTLREQLLEVKTWQYQPTLYLTLACIGLAEALAEEDPSAKHDRARTLPHFLDQASHNIDRVPLLFRDIGLEMVSDTRNYLIFLEKKLPELKHALLALDRFEKVLKTVTTRDDFALPINLFEHVVRSHLGCNADIQDVNELLEQEIHDMQQIMDEEANRIMPNRIQDRYDNERWAKVIECLPVPAIVNNGLIELYQSSVNNLARHCVDKELVSARLVSSCPVHVAPMPSYLAAIRTASSYSIPAVHPPAGGVFYVNYAEITGTGNQDRLREYQMLTAHETYPGHHLLDVTRWSFKNSIRRVIEQPIFYEGWACFAEELMRLTGYFCEPVDRFLLAKRRLWRAIRGKVDLGLQTGTMNFASAVDYLKKTGIGTEWAVSSVKKYTLNPGYQLCYTIGIRQFLDLFDRFGYKNLPKFVKTILEQGEINFANLEKVLHLSNLN